MGATARRLLPLVLVVVAMVGAGAPRATARDDASVVGDLNDLLEERSQALAAGDRDAWMAALDPQAGADFRASQQATFDGLRTLGVTGYQLTVDPDSGNLAPPDLDERYGADTFVPSTEARYRIEGFDDRDALDDLWWTYVRRDGDWFVASDSDLEVVGLETARNLWDLGPLSVLRSDRVLVLSHPSRQSRGNEVAGLAEEALTRIDKDWDRAWSNKIVIVVPDNADEVERILRTTLDLSNFVAFVNYGTDRDDGYENTAARMYLNDARLGRHNRSFQLDTLVHELVHAASSGDAGPFLDSWMHEGVAEWVADGRPTKVPEPAGSDGTIPEGFEFSTGSLRDIVRSYDAATSLMAYIAERFGRDAPGKFFANVGHRRVVPGTQQYQDAMAMREELGIGPDELEDDWARDR